MSRIPMLTLLFLLAFLRADPIRAAYTVSLAPRVILPGDVVTCDWQNPSGAGVADFIGFYQTGASDSSYIVNVDLNSFSTGGRWSFTTPSNLPLGLYECRIVLYLWIFGYSPYVSSNKLTIGVLYSQCAPFAKQQSQSQSLEQEQDAVVDTLAAVSISKITQTASLRSTTRRPPSRTRPGVATSVIRRHPTPTRTRLSTPSNRSSSPRTYTRSRTRTRTRTRSSPPTPSRTRRLWPGCESSLAASTNTNTNANQTPYVSSLPLAPSLFGIMPIRPISSLPAPSAVERLVSALGAPNASLPVSNFETNTFIPIRYYGGPVMTSCPLGVYAIYYGAPGLATSPKALIINRLMSTLGNSPWWRINHAYSQQDGRRVPVGLRMLGAKQSVACYRPNTFLEGDDTWRLIEMELQMGLLPVDTRVVYLLITGDDVSIRNSPALFRKSFCADYCGFHFAGRFSNHVIKYAVIGDASKLCPGSCDVRTPSVNNDPGADAMASIMAHELSEAATNPEGGLGNGAWFDERGEENADKCVYTYGDTRLAENGAAWNVEIAQTRYLIQQNWRLANNLHGQGCGLTD